ncbi:MAG: hypothetical protein WC244_03315 [Patescibacteria group bacterium]
MRYRTSSNRGNNGGTDNMSDTGTATLPETKGRRVTSVRPKNAEELLAEQMRRDGEFAHSIGGKSGLSTSASTAKILSLQV